MAQYSSDVVLIIDRDVAAGTNAFRLIRESHGGITGPQLAGLRQHLADLATLDAYVTVSMPTPWAAWWATWTDEEREAARVVLGL